MDEQNEDVCIQSRNDQVNEDSSTECPPVLSSNSSSPETKHNEPCQPVDTNGTVKDAETPTSAPILLSAVTAPELDPENVLRSPPKLVPAVVAPKRKSEETISKSIKPLTGSMKNTPASLSIIDAPSSTLNKSTRSTRSSIDPTFAAKQRSFLNKVHNALSSAPLDDLSCESDPEIAADEDAHSDRSSIYMPGHAGIVPRRLSGLQNSGNKRRREDIPAQKGKIPSASSIDHSVSPGVIKDAIEPIVKKRPLAEDSEDKASDIFCWLCHREDPDMGCATCPRAYHGNCLRRPSSNSSDSEWMCPECVTILKAESQETRSKALKMLTLDQLCKLLLFAVERMKYCSGANVFEGQVDPEEFPTYHDYIINPMYLALLEKNIKKKMYGSTEAFVADASWIVHNCIVFNSIHSKLTSIAKNILRVCKQEMSEIENCPDCYNYAYTADDNWFIQVCQKPHVLVWAKLKGFPFWPAKAMRCNSDAIDVRFFGAHDKAWVPARDCYLYSQENPNPNALTKPQPSQASLKKRNPKNNLDVCIEELEMHIQLLKEKYTVFQYAPARTPVVPKNLESHLKFMLPEYNHLETKSATPLKVSPHKRNSSENLKTSAVSIEPVIKRMKADSSSRQIIKLFHNAEEKEQSSSNSAIKQECEESKQLCLKSNTEAADEINSTATSSSSISKCGETTKAPQEKCSDSLKPVSQHSMLPGQSHTSPLTSTDKTSIADICLKKKDARKVGLVDRLQEKIALWVARSTNVDTTSEDITDSDFEQKPPSQDKDNSEDKASSTNGCISPSETKGANGKEAEETPSPNESSMTSTKIDVTDTAQSVSKCSVNELLESFNLKKNQPKVILKKLVMKSEADVDSKSSEEKIAVKTENLSDEEIDQISREDESQLGTTAKKIIISELKLISDGDDSQTQTILSNCNVAPSETELSSQAVDPVTSTTYSTATSSLPTKKVHKNSNIKSVSDHKKPRTLIKALTISDKSDVSKTQSPGTVLCKQEPESDSESKPKTESVTPNQVDVESSNIVENPVRKRQSLKTKRKDSPSRKTARKSIAGSNSSKAIGRDETFKKAFVKKPKLTSTKSSSDLKSVITDSEEPSNALSPKMENALSPNNDTDTQLSALKSLLSKNVTVSLESPSKSDVKEVVINTDKVKTLSENNISPHMVSVSLPNSKAKTIVIQSGNTKVLQESPPKILTSFTTTTHSQRLAHGATSILKMVKSLSPAEMKSPCIVSESEEISKHSTPRTYIVKKNIAITRPQNTNPTPVKSTYVTVSHTSTGVPVVRRLLPTAIPLTPPLTSPVSGTGSILISNKTDSSSPENVAKITQRISVRSLPTVVTSTTTSSPRPIPSLEQSTQVQEERSILKKSLVTVGTPLETMAENSATASASLREMPPLSIASVCSLQPPVQTLSGATSVQTSTSSKKKGPKISAGVGPLSNELHTQASKMTDVFMSCLKDCLSDMGNKGSLEAQIRCLQLDIEHMQWQHQQEIEELRHNTELMITEVKDRMKVESQLAVNTALATARKEKEAAVEATKAKQWCAFCKKEAMFYCCWNTSYCDYRCQQNHWPSHSLTCTQNTSSNDAERPSPLENGQPTRRIIIRRKEVLSPPLLKKC